MRTTGIIKSSILVFISLASLILLLGSVEKPKPSFELEGVISVAHRGASGSAPENTMVAFKKGIAAGVDYIELDIHLSKDDHVVIIHDPTVNRTTNGFGYVRNLTLEEIKRLDAGSKFHPFFAGEPIITLDELFDELLHKVGIIIEIKNPEINVGIEEILADVINRYNNTENIIIQSANFESMKKVNQLLPEIPVAVLISKSKHPLSSEELDEIAEYATYINYNIRYLRKEDVEEIHKRNKKVMAWTIREPSSMNKALQLGVDGIITDYPRWIVNKHNIAIQE